MANTRENMMTVEIDDGTLAVQINNRFGEELGVFRFNPTDLGIIERWQDMEAEFGDIVAPLENIDINADGTAADGDNAAFAALTEAKSRLLAACDKLFGGNCAEAFFTKRHPFSAVNGKFYCENVLNVVGAIIEKQFGVETTKISKNVDKYIHGYPARTGKHKDGKK